MSFHPRLLKLSALLCVLGATSHAQEPLRRDTRVSTVTAYPAAYFARSRMYSAFDMLALIPGYTFVDSDREIRGYASAAGNVLIDGSRPASKYEPLEAILRRIPASAVQRIELIRDGTPGVDMQGHAALANVVRADGAHTRGSVEVENAFYERDLDAPRLAGEMARRSGDRLIELSASIYQTIEDELGAGRRVRVSPQGEVLRDGSYIEDTVEKAMEVAAGYENTALDGRLRLHGSLQQSSIRADILEEVTFPAARATGIEFGEESASELGMHFDRNMTGATELEVFAIWRDMRVTGGERAVSADDSSLFREESAASESILHTLVRHHGKSWTLEGGVEMALNSLESRSRLIENDAIVAIPSSYVGVRERRGEVFVAGKRNLSAAWRVELAARFELSRLTQSGDSMRSKSFFFPKPRALATWSRDRNQIRLLIEREVGQLEFEDFASSASLSTGTVTAGNPELRPHRAWRAELDWERRLPGSGAMTIALRREAIEDVIDRIPVVADTVFDSVGNIGAGVRDELEIDITVPLESVGVSTGVLKAAALWRHSKTTDPVTRESRAISEDEPFEASIHFQQALPRWKARWGVDLTLAELTRRYFFDEVRTDREGAMLDVFVEWAPAPSWSVRLYANNLTDRESVQRRAVHAGVRNEAALRYVDTRKLGLGPYVGVLVRRSFGD